MLRINQIKLPLEAELPDMKKAAADALKISQKDIINFQIAKKSVDCRKKDNIFFVYSFDMEITDEEKILNRNKSKDILKIEPFVYTQPEIKRNSQFRPIVVGFGPAGMFCALTLARAGLKPIVLERGDEVEKRTAKVKAFWETKVLDESSNVQFGEGGAGTFSDGKLTTGIKDPLCRKVFTELVDHGAPEEILYSAKPHIGTDKLADVVKNIRNEVIALGGDVHFNSRLTDIIVANGVIHGIRYNCKTDFEIETDTVIFAIGHSSRDTVKMLYDRGIKMMQKPFSMGVRIEHPREFIDKAQYGSFAGHPKLGAADYKMACHPPHGRGAYTFCMCPGGTVVAASSENGGMVVNGMSEYARDAQNSNSALLVGVNPEDFPNEHPLSGIDLQRKIERTAFNMGGGDYTAPAQLVGDFLNNTPSTKLGAVKPSCPTGVTPSDIRKVLPKKITDTLADALLKMNNMLKGFTMPEAVLTAPETRSSSPVRILRDEYYQCNIRGIFPCGEGAGYAGGIVSAAVDGIRVAHAVFEDESYMGFET